MCYLNKNLFIPYIFNIPKNNRIISYNTIDNLYFWFGILNNWYLLKERKRKYSKEKNISNLGK